MRAFIFCILASSFMYSCGSRNSAHDFNAGVVPLQHAVLIDTSELKQGKVIHEGFTISFQEVSLQEAPLSLYWRLRLPEKNDLTSHSPDLTWRIDLDTSYYGFLITELRSDSSIDIQAKAWRPIAMKWESDSLVYFSVLKMRNDTAYGFPYFIKLHLSK